MRTRKPVQRQGGSKEGRSPLLCRFKDGVQGKGNRNPFPWRAFSFCPLSLCTSKEKMDSDQPGQNDNMRPPGRRRVGDHSARLEKGRRICDCLFLICAPCLLLSKTEAALFASGLVDDFGPSLRGFRFCPGRAPRKRSASPASERRIFFRLYAFGFSSLRVTGDRAPQPPRRARSSARFFFFESLS